MTASFLAHAPALSRRLSARLVRSVADNGDALRADERQAFEERMRAAWPGVVRLVERLLAWPGSGSEVEDVAQETFLAAWHGRHTFRKEAEWTTWVHSIALRRARNAARASGRRQRWFGRLSPGREFDALSTNAASDPASDAVSGNVRDVLRRLRHTDREVLVLRYLEGQAVEEIAARLGLERAAVDARLSRARTRMRRFLDDLEAPR